MSEQDTFWDRFMPSIVAAFVVATYLGQIANTFRIIEIERKVDAMLNRAQSPPRNAEPMPQWQREAAAPGGVYGRGRVRTNPPILEGPPE